MILFWELCYLHQWIYIRLPSSETPYYFFLFGALYEIYSCWKTFGLWRRWIYILTFLVLIDSCISFTFFFWVCVCLWLLSVSVIQTYDTVGFMGSPESQAQGKIWFGSHALTARQEGTDPPQAGVRLSSDVIGPLFLLSKGMLIIFSSLITWLMRDWDKLPFNYSCLSTVWSHILSMLQASFLSQKMLLSERWVRGLGVGFKALGAVGWCQSSGCWPYLWAMLERKGTVQTRSNGNHSNGLQTLHSSFFPPVHCRADSYWLDLLSLGVPSAFLFPVWHVDESLLLGIHGPESLLRQN